MEYNFGPRNSDHWDIDDDNRLAVLNATLEAGTKRQIRILVTSEYLESRFEAGPGSDNWLASAREHHDEIMAEVNRRIVPENLVNNTVLLR